MSRQDSPDFASLSPTVRRLVRAPRKPQKPALSGCVCAIFEQFSPVAKNPAQKYPTRAFKTFFGTTFQNS